MKFSYTEKAPKEEQIKTLPAIEQLRSLGHKMRQTGQRMKCTSCGQSWMDRDNHVLLEQGSCPSASIWGIDKEADVSRPLIIPQGGPMIIFNGHILDRSHKLKWRHGLLYCSTCGAVSVSRTVLLSKPCRMRPINAVANYRLRSMSTQRAPLPGGTWPDPTAVYPWDGRY